MAAGYQAGCCAAPCPTLSFQFSFQICFAGSALVRRQVVGIVVVGMFAKAQQAAAKSNQQHRYHNGRDYIVDCVNHTPMNAQLHKNAFHDRPDHAVIHHIGTRKQQAPADDFVHFGGHFGFGTAELILPVRREQEAIRLGVPCYQVADEVIGVKKAEHIHHGDAHHQRGNAVFLASEASDFVNGLILYVDGGILAYIGKQPQ